MEQTENDSTQAILNEIQILFEPYLSMDNKDVIEEEKLISTEDIIQQVSNHQSSVEQSLILPEIYQELKLYKVDLHKFEEIIRKVWVRNLNKLNQIAFMLRDLARIRKYSEKISKEDKRRIKSSLKKVEQLKRNKKKKFYFRQNAETKIKDSFWMTQLMQDLARSLNPFFKERMGQGSQVNAQIREKTVQIVTKLMNYWFNYPSPFTFNQVQSRTRKHRENLSKTPILN